MLWADDFVSHLIVSGDKDQGIFTVQNQRPQSNRKKNTYCFSLHRLLWFCLLPPEKVADLGTCHMRFLTIDRFLSEQDMFKRTRHCQEMPQQLYFPQVFNQSKLTFDYAHILQSSCFLSLWHTFFVDSASSIFLYN